MMKLKNPSFSRVRRSLAKSITFRILIIISDAVIIYLITHRLDMTLGIVLFRNAASTVLYYFHERAWNRVEWGRTTY